MEIPGEPAGEDLAPLDIRNQLRELFRLAEWRAARHNGWDEEALEDELEELDE